MPERKPQGPARTRERYWAVLCIDRHPASSTAALERWYGPHDSYEEALGYTRLLLAQGTTYISGHVCKRLEREDATAILDARRREG